MDSKVVIYKSKSKAFGFIIASLILVVAGWIFLEIPGRNVVGWSFVILSVLCLIFGIGTYFDKKPYIILTESGVTDMSVFRDEVEWDDILHVDDFYYRGLYFVRLLVARDYMPTSFRPSWFYRFDKLYEKEGLKAIYIRVGFYQVNSIKLASFIRRMIDADAEKRKELLANFHTLK